MTTFTKTSTSKETILVEDDPCDDDNDSNADDDNDDNDADDDDNNDNDNDDDNDDNDADNDDDGDDDGVFTFLDKKRSIDLFVERTGRVMLMDAAALKSPPAAST